METRFSSAAANFRTGLRLLALLKILGASQPNQRLMILVAVDEVSICQSRRTILSSVLLGMTSDSTLRVCLRLEMALVPTQMERLLNLPSCSITEQNYNLPPTSSTHQTKIIKKDILAWTHQIASSENGKSSISEFSYKDSPRQLSSKDKVDSQNYLTKKREAKKPYSFFMIRSSFINLHSRQSAKKGLIFTIIKCHMSNNYHTITQNQTTLTAPPLPSLQDALSHWINAYYLDALDRIESYFGKGERKLYEQLSNQEIFHRGYFLHYIYEALINLKEISNPYQKQSFQPFKCFLTGLFLTSKDYTDIIRTKNQCYSKNEALPQATKRILGLLYETEFYIYQTLLRMLMFKLAFEEQERLQAIYQRSMFPEFFSESRQLFTSKRDRAFLKKFFKEIETILEWYHQELSISRSECNSRPEANCLVRLLKTKFSQHIFEYIRENTKFKCQGEVPISRNLQRQIKVTLLKAPQLLPSPPSFNQNPLDLPKLSKKQSNQSQIIKQFKVKQNKAEKTQQNKQDIHFQVQASPPPRPISNYLTSTLRRIEKEQSQNEKAAYRQQAQSKQTPSEILETQNKQKPKRQKSKVNPLIEAHKRDSDQFSKKSSDHIQSNLPEFRYDRHLHPGTPSQKNKRKLKHIPLRDQIKEPKHLKRFSNTQCNLKYTVAKVKSSTKREAEKMQINKFISNNPPLPKAPVNYFKKQKKRGESEESYLAQETPVYRNRTCFQSDMPN